MTAVLQKAIVRARIGITTTFGLAGFVCAVWTVRIPGLTDKLRLDPGELGIAVLCWGVGAMLTLQATRVLLPRVGSRRAVRFGGPASAVLSAGVGLAPNYPTLLVAAAAFGAAFGVLDVSMNAQAAAVERAYRRHVMNTAHAGWSVGSVLGGGLGALTAYAGVSVTAAVVGTAVGTLPVALALLSTYLPDPPQPAAGRLSHRLPRVIYLVGAVTTSSFIIEGAVATWSGLFLRNELHTTEGLAALGYPTFELAMIIGRTLGDRIRAAVGSVRMLSVGGLGVVAGILFVLLARSAPVALAGFFVVGLAVCTVVPITFSIAGALDPSGAGIAQAGAMGYGGMLLGPVVIGALANATSVRGALLVVVPLGVAITVLSRVVHRRVPSTQNGTDHPAQPVVP